MSEEKPSPLSSMGRRGTFSKTKSFRKPGFNLENSHSSLNHPHTYKYLNGEEYSGPEISQIQIQSPPSTPRNRSSSVASNSSNSSASAMFDEEEAKIPVYLGPDGTLYNKYYIAVKILGIDEGSSTPKGGQQSSPTVKHFNGSDPIFTAFPEHAGFENYFDYEQSVLDWGSQVTNAMGAVRLPRTMGRAYSRPRITNGDRMMRKNSEASNEDSLSANDNGSDPNDNNSSTGGHGHDADSKHSDTADGNGPRTRSDSDTSTGSFENQIENNSPVDGSPSSGSLTGLVNGTRSRSNSSTYFDPRNQRSNSLSPKQSLQSRLGDSGDFKLGRGNSMASMDEDRWTLSKDPWDSQLVLQEPIPELYNNFEGYELAMRNWAVEVIVKTPVLPPHASQLSQLPAKTIEKAAGADSTEGAIAKPGRNASGIFGSDAPAHDSDTVNRWVVRSGLVDVQSDDMAVNMRAIDVIDRLFEATYGNGGRFFEKVELRAEKQWQKMAAGEAKMNLADTFEKWYRRKLNWHRNSLTNYKGGVWGVHLLMPTIPTGWKEALLRKSAVLPPLPIRALRRTDIQSEADGKRVELGLLSPQLPMDLSKLLKPNMNIQYILSMFDTLTPVNPLAPINAISAEETKAYIRTCRAYDRRLVHAFRFDSFYSWNKYPTTAGVGVPVAQSSDVTAMLQSQKQDIEAILVQQPFDLASVIGLVNTPGVFLDKFQECFDFDTSLGIASLYAPTLPSLVMPTTPTAGNAPTSPIPPSPQTTGSSGLGQSTSSLGGSTGLGPSALNLSTSPNHPVGTPTKQFSFPGNTPNSPHHLASPPSRSGSLSSFAFGSPASNKILLSPSHNSAGGGGIDSPRPSRFNDTLQVTPQPNQQLIQQQGTSPRANNLTGGSGGSSTPPTNPYTTHFFSYITTHTFPEVLTVFEKVNSPLAHAKLSSLILACLASEKGSLLIENIIISKDITSLYRIAQATSHFDCVPFDLYPYPTHLNLVMVPSIAKGSTQEVVRLVFMYYYLNIIQERVNFYSTNPSVISCINSSKKETAERIGNQIQSDKELLNKIFKALGRKSSTVSHCFLFILIQLMRMTEYSQIISFLKLKDSMIPHLRDLSNSKFLHSQFAARRLFTILQEDGWKEFLYSEYSEKDALINDLTFVNETSSDSKKPKLPVSKAGGAGHHSSSSSSSSDKGSLLSELAFNMCITTLDGISSSAHIPSVRFLLNDQLFLQIYNVIKSSKTSDRNLENLSRLFAYICKTAVRFGMIKKNDQIKVNKKSSTEQEILISPPFMFELLSMVLSNTNDKPIVKNYMLESLRHLLKPAELFEILKKEANLYNKLLIVSCREGKNPDFNRNSWRLFFQIIRLHPGHIEFLEKGKFLNQFIEIINTNAGPVVLANSLHYLTKLFSLVVYENRRATLWKGFVSDVKHTEKDVKTLRDFFTERHMFIKIHMVYRRYMESYPGRPFINLCNLYQALATLPICQKLFKDTIKNSDYREGFAKISKHFKDDSTVITK